MLSQDDGMNIPQGTAATLEFSDRIPVTAQKVREFHGHGEAAEMLLVCKSIIERLAPFEGDIEVQEGEN